MHLIRMYDMKYKEKVTYRTTASGGQEIITEQVPVYNKFEQFAKKQHDKRINKINGTKDGKPMKIPFILKHPGICALILGVFIILVVYLISSANTYMDDLIKQYTSLTAKTNDSKYAFDKKLFYVTVEADGTKKITFGYKSEEQKEQAEEAADEAASTGTITSGNGASWSGSGIALKAMDFYTPVKFDTKGTATSVNINDVKLYTGIPWDDDGKWYQLNTDSVKSYVKTNLGKELSSDSSAHIDQNNSSTKISKNGVDCAGIAWFPIFCFSDINEDGSIAKNYSKSLCNQYYGVAILEKGGSTYYLPICSGGDNKGHTWPGGLVQTYVGNGTRYNNSSDIITFNSGGTQDTKDCLWGSNKISGMTMSMSEFVGGWGTQMGYQNPKNVGRIGHPMLTIEANKSYQKALSGYSIKGFIIHNN